MKGSCMVAEANKHKKGNNSTLFPFVTSYKIVNDVYFLGALLPFTSPDDLL